MKLLLTSARIKNQSILDALVDLVGKPIAEESSLHTDAGVRELVQHRPARGVHQRTVDQPMIELGWRSSACWS